MFPDRGLIAAIIMKVFLKTNLKNGKICAIILTLFLCAYIRRDFFNEYIYG